MDGDKEYYISSRDNILNFAQTKQFCKMWGGELVSLSERKELAALERRRGSDPELYWYESETCQLFSFATSLERGDCASLNAFICVRSNEKSEVVEVEPTIYHEKEEEEAEEARIAA